MAKNSGGNGTLQNPSRSALSQKDADRFRKQARTYARKATSSEEAARSTLISLGIHTKSGKLSKKYA